MNAYIFTVQADADAFSTAMDTRTGPYPKAGVDVGGGIHVPPAQSRTVRYGNVVKHPTLSLWRYPADARVAAEVAGGVTVPVTGAIQVVDVTWFN